MEVNMFSTDEKIVFKKYLIPSMLSMLAVSAYSFVDTFVVGQEMGAQAVGAMGVGTPMVCILFSLGILFGSGGAINYSVSMSTGKVKEGRDIFSTAVMTALFFGIAICVCGNIWIEELADFLGATDGNRELTVDYLRWIVSLSGFMIMDLVLNNFMRNEGHPNVSMVATVTGTTLNIFLDFIFVMGFKWGMGGAASATVIASVISVGICLTYSAKKKTNLRVSFRSFNFKHFLSMMKIGLSGFVLEGAVAIITVVFLNAAGKFYGDDGVSAFSILITVNLVCYSLLNGVAQAAQPLISSNYAVNNTGRVDKFVRYALLTSIMMGVFFFIVGEAFTKPICSLFGTDNVNSLALATGGLRYYSFAFIFMAVSIIYGVYFQSVTKPVQSLKILLGRSLVLPVLMMLILTSVMGKGGIWLAVPLGELLAMLISIFLRTAEKSRRRAATISQ